MRRQLSTIIHGTVDVDFAGDVFRSALSLRAVEETLLEHRWAMFHLLHGLLVRLLCSVPSLLILGSMVAIRMEDPLEMVGTAVDRLSKYC